MLMQHGDGERLLSKSNVGRLPSSHHPALPLSLSFLICKMEMKPFVQMRIEIRYHKMLLPIYSIWSLLITCSMFPFLIIHFYEFIYHIVFAV